MLKREISGSFKDMVQPDLSEMSLKEYEYLNTINKNGLDEFYSILDECLTKKLETKKTIDVEHKIVKGLWEKYKQLYPNLYIENGP